MVTTEVVVGRREPGWTDITAIVTDYCVSLGDGLVNVFAPHSTVGLALLQMNDGAGEDVIAAIGRVIPRDVPYHHQEKAPGHGADHVLPALVSPTLTIPVVLGVPQLGTFQQVVLIDLDEQPSERRLLLTFVGGA